MGRSSQMGETVQLNHFNFKEEMVDMLLEEFADMFLEVTQGGL